MSEPEEALHPERLTEARVFTTAPSDSRDRVLLRINEHWFVMTRENFSIFASRMQEDAKCLRAEALERTEAVVRRLGMGGIEEKE